MDDTNNGRPFTTGQCLRCGMEAIGGICGECLAELADFIDGADLAGLARWAAAWPAGRGAVVAIGHAGDVKRNVTLEPAEIAPAERPVTMREARVCFRKDCLASCPGRPGAVRYWRAGDISTMWQISARHGGALDREHDLWWTDFDIDYAYFAPAEAVEVLAVLEERAEGGEVSRGHA